MMFTEERLLELMGKVQEHAHAMMQANAHDPSYVQGWRSATNTFLAVLHCEIAGVSCVGMLATLQGSQPEATAVDADGFALLSNEGVAPEQQR